MTRSVSLPALGRSVSLAAYVAAVRRAKAALKTEFRSGLDSWWPVTGAEIVRQFRRAMHQRISEAVPYAQRSNADAALKHPAPSDRKKEEV